MDKILFFSFVLFRFLRLVNNRAGRRHKICGFVERIDLFMKKYVCTVCGYVYDPAEGAPDAGIAPGTAFEDLPEDFVCPVCGVGKELFEEDA